MSKHEHIHIILGGLIGLLLIGMLFLDYESNKCQSNREKTIIYNLYLASNGASYFTSLWTLQFFKDENLITNSPHGSLSETASISANMAQRVQDQFINSLNNSNCNIWGYLKLFIIFVAFILGTVDIFLTLKLRQ